MLANDEIARVVCEERGDAEVCENRRRWVR